MFELKFTIHHRAAEVCHHWQQASLLPLVYMQITDLGITLAAETNALVSDSSTIAARVIPKSVIHKPRA